MSSCFQLLPFHYMHFHKLTMSSYTPLFVSFISAFTTVLIVRKLVIQSEKNRLFGAGVRQTDSRQTGKQINRLTERPLNEVSGKCVCKWIEGLVACQLVGNFHPLYISMFLISNVHTLKFGMKLIVHIKYFCLSSHPSFGKAIIWVKLVLDFHSSVYYLHISHVRNLKLPIDFLSLHFV